MPSPPLLRRPRALLMDLDDTLYPYAPAHKAAHQAALNWLQTVTGLPLDTLETAYATARRRVQVQLKEHAASHHRLLYFQALCEALQLPVFHLAPAATDHYWKTFLSHMTLSPDARLFLETVHAQGLPVVLVTDLVADIQFQKVLRLGVADLIQTLVSSEEAGVEKPNPAMFHLALAKLGLLPQDVWMIGDAVEKDLWGAHLLGIQPVWIPPVGLPPTTNSVPPDTLHCPGGFTTLLEHWRALP